MRIVTHPEADQELTAAALWYEAQQPGLGEAFLAEFEATLRRLAEAPTQARVICGDSRKYNFRRFPYAIVYSAHSELLVIKAVMHLHRRPFYWQSRRLLK